MTDEQRAAMMARFPETRTEVLAEEFGVCYRTVCRWAVELGLKKTKRFRMAASAAARTVCTKRYYGQPPKPSQSQVADAEGFMRQHFATMMNGALAQLLGVNERTIRRWSQDLGLKKDMSIIYQKRYSMKAKNQPKGQAIPADVYEQLERLAYQVIIRLCENRLEQLDSATVEDVMQAIEQKPEAKKPKTKTDIEFVATMPKPDGKSLVDKFNEEQQMFEKMKRGGKAMLSDETVNKMIELYKHGATIDEIKKQLNIKSANSIYRYLRRNGIEPHRVKDMTKKPKEETPADVARQIVDEQLHGKE